jgi:uncharacterized protein
MAWLSVLQSDRVREAYWDWTQSIGMIRAAFDGRMFPMTLDGITRAMRALG